MAVDKPDAVDFVSRTREGECELAISDHLRWGGDGSHLLLLQEKLNRYLAFIEAGELVESFPEYIGVPVLIRVYCMFEPDSDGIKFLSLARGLIENAGFHFEYKLGLG